MSVLRVLAGRYAVCRLEAEEAVPASVLAPHRRDPYPGFASVTRTARELSVVCEEDRLPEGTRREGGWRVLEVEGPLDFGLTGILAEIAAPLAQVGVSIFSVSTYDTDYVLVKEENLAKAVEALRAAGHSFSNI